MGHLQGMTPKQRQEFLSHKFKRATEERRGNSFEWFNYEKHTRLTDNMGWNWFTFNDMKLYTFSQVEAKEVVLQLRADNNFARIICGMEQCVQRIKSFSIIYKPKKKNQNINP